MKPVLALVGLRILLVTVVSTSVGIAAASVWHLEWSSLEIFATVTGIQGVFLLARNQVSGWVVGLASVGAFVLVFARARLLGDVAVQLFYLATSLQAIRLWLRPQSRGPFAPPDVSQRRVTWAPHRLVLVTIPVFLLAWLTAYLVLSALGAAVPSWTSLTTVMSFTAQLYLLGRYVQSWLIYIAADVIYIPLFLSLDLTLTAGLYVVFMALSTSGLVRFIREASTTHHPIQGLQSVV